MDERDTQLFDVPQATPIPAGRAHLLVLEGVQVGRRFPIEMTSTTIGRGEKADLRIDDIMASRVHARIFYESAEWVLEDLESHNGTRVNGVGVRRQAVRIGDRIQIGETLFLFAHRDPLEERIRHRQKLEMLGRLGAGIAHDVNNLLASILTNAELLTTLVREKGAESGDIEACLADVRSAARRGAELTHRIVEHAQLGSGEDETVDLSAVVREATELVRRTFDTSIAIETLIAPGVCVRGNRASLHQVVMNLLVNARDGMKGGTLRIRVDAVNPETQPAGELAFAGRYALLEITDERLAAPVATSEGPANPALQTVHEIVGEHGGRVSYDAVPTGGATARVVLPALSTTPSRAARPTPITTPRLAGKSAGPRSILVVDDDPLIRRALVRVLGRDGYSLLEADGGEAAIELVARHTDLGLVILDLDMPGLDGEATFDVLRTRAQELPVVFLTGLCDDTRRRTLLSRGAREILIKPCAGEILRRTVKSVLAMAPG